MGTEPQCVILLYRAILTLHAVPDPDLRYFAEAGSSWPEYPRRYLDAYSPDDDSETAWQPTPHDVSVYLHVLTWMRDLTRRQRTVLVLRARNYSLPLIADVLRLALDHVEQDHADAVCLVAKAALRDHNMWRGPLDNPLQIAAVSRPHHCAQSAVVFSHQRPAARASAG